MDADEAGNIIEGTDRYASSVAPSSPAKDQPNTGRSRKEKTRRGSSSPITASVLTDSDSTVHPRGTAPKKSTKDRDKSVSGSKKALMARPPVKHAKTTSSLPRRDAEAAYYGVEPTLATASTHSRAQCSGPASYYPPSRPPMANTWFYTNQPPGPAPPGHPPFPPPPSWGGPYPGPGPAPMPPPPYGPPSPPSVIMNHPHPPPPDFIRPLESRFVSTRPQSSIGFHPSHTIGYEEYDEHDEALVPRPSTARRVSRGEEDRRAMPPPQRPASARPTALAFRPAPSNPARRSVVFDDRDTDIDDPLFRDPSPLPPESYEHMPPMAYRPHSSFGEDNGFDDLDYHTELVGKGHRRHSYYGGHSSGSAYEEKMRQASRYQDDVAGGPQLPLTAESLRKAGRNGGSSRSTRSSASHDESEYKQSATTRTTRSMANDENVMIRVMGRSKLKLGNAELQCQDGAEINIISGGGGAHDSRAAGSDKSSYADQDDRRTRIDFPSARSRARSRARSFSRPLPTYEASPEYDRYAYAPPLPPSYPAYPSPYPRPNDEYFGSPL